VKFDDGKFKIEAATREISAHIFYPCTILIAGILGIPTDALAKIIISNLPGAK
jgi:hypothetical protein